MSPSKRDVICKMAAAKQAQIPGCGSGGYSLTDLLGARTSGAVCPVGPRCLSRSTQGEGLWKQRNNRHTSPRGPLLQDRSETEIVIPGGGLPR